MSDQVDAAAMATLAHFYSDIMGKDLVYLPIRVRTNQRIPVKIDAMMPKRTIHGLRRHVRRLAYRYTRFHRKRTHRTKIHFFERKSMKLAIFLLLCVSLTANATGIQEVNYWRSKNGLKPFIEVHWMTDFCQKKAEYRAARGLKDNHAGKRCPAGCIEGCAESTPDWGWHTCCTEESGRFAGAGVAIGEDGERYMVLLVWGKGGNRRNIRPLKTAHLTKDAPIIKRIAWSSSKTTRKNQVTTRGRKRLRWFRAR